MPKSKERKTGDEVKRKKKTKPAKISRVTVKVRKIKERADTMFIAYENDTLPEFLKRYKKELGDLDKFNVILKEGNNDKAIEDFDFSGKKEVYFTFRNKRNPKKKDDSSGEEE